MKKNKTWDLTDTQTVEVIGGDTEHRIEKLEKAVKELQNKLELIVLINGNISSNNK